MKSGISLVDMAKEIQRQADLKADYMPVSYTHLTLPTT